MTRSFIIEGIDRLGKSTLIDSLLNRLGHFEVIHYQKPKVLSFYKERYGAEAKKMYQMSAFNSMFSILNSDARVILDRAHLGEMVYAPIYRGYSGSYVFDLERSYAVSGGRLDHVRMILLTENFDISTHFIDDGESFDASKRKEEQNLFIEAFNKSIIKDKKIICVTGEDGNFRSTQDILEEAIS